jgi:hypothetical protein
MTKPSLDLQPCSLSDLGELGHGFARATLPSGHPLLVIRLEGTASNKTDATFDLAAAIVMAGLEAWQPWALILDLRGLDYSWGDRMQNVLDAAQRWYEPLYPLRRAFGGERLSERFPLALLTSELCRDGLASLLRDEMHLEASALLFESLDEAAVALDLTLEGVTPM